MAPWAWERGGHLGLSFSFAGSHMSICEYPGDLRARPPAGHDLHQSAVRWVSMPVSSVLTGLLNPKGGSLCRPRPAGGFKNRADPGGLCTPADPVRGIRVAQICFPLGTPRSGGEGVIMVGGHAAGLEVTGRPWASKCPTRFPVAPGEEKRFSKLPPAPRRHSRFNDSRDPTYPPASCWEGHC